MPQQFIKHVGLDVHATTIAVAVAESQPHREVRDVGVIANQFESVRKLAHQLTGDSQATLHFWYEAGPCGYGLYRQLLKLGHTCQVVAPSLTPRKPGDRVKTDRRDAMTLARLGRAGELTSVWVPSEEDEAMRDLTRCRADAKQTERQARQQLNSFLLRHDRFFTEGSKWTQRHRRWLLAQRFAQPLAEYVYQDYLGQVDQAGRRVTELEQRIEQAAQAWSRWPLVQGWMAMRGIDWTTASSLAAELGDLTRFKSPRQLMAFVGLTPCEHSSGLSQKRGGITKSGNAHARRLLVECAWSYRFPARLTQAIQARARHAPASVQTLAWRAQQRLCRRYRDLMNKGKRTVQTTPAVARELCGFLWAIALEIEQQESVSPAGEPSRGL